MFRSRMLGSVAKAYGAPQVGIHLSCVEFEIACLRQRGWTPHDSRLDDMTRGLVWTAISRACFRHAGCPYHHRVSLVAEHASI